MVSTFTIKAVNIWPPYTVAIVILKFDKHFYNIEMGSKEWVKWPTLVRLLLQETKQFNESALNNLAIIKNWYLWV